MIKSLPTFDVSRMSVFLKSISRPSPSSIIPLSKTWKKISCTSAVGFFDFVEQDHAIRPAADGLGEHAALAVSDVSGRRALQGGNRVRFLKLAHVDRDDVLLAAVQSFGKCECRLRLADAAGAGEQKHADRFVRIVEVGSRRLNSLGDHFQGMVLADDALIECLGQIQDGRDFVLNHFSNGDSGPIGHDRRDRLLIDAGKNQRRLALQRMQLVSASR